MHSTLTLTGMHLDEQVAALNAAKEYFTKMRYLCKGDDAKWAIKPFQHGFMITINATIMLQRDLAIRFGVAHILTGPLSQDELERKFGEIRGLGGGFCLHPSAKEYLERLSQSVKIDLLKDTSFNVLSRKDKIMELQCKQKEEDAYFDQCDLPDPDISEMVAKALAEMAKDVTSKFKATDFGSDFKTDFQKMYALFNQSHPKDSIQKGLNLIKGK